MRRLSLAPRSPALVQVQGVDGEAAGGEVVGLLGVEEVVGEPVHQQHGVGRRPVGLAPAHESGDEVTFAVGIRAEAERQLPVPGQHIRLPSRHNRHLNRAGRPTRADEDLTRAG